MPVSDPIQNDDEAVNLPWWIKTAGVFGVLLLAGAIAFGIFVRPAGLEEFSHLGEFGDFVGGVGNPLLALLGFLALLYTLALQQRELRYTRHELELTREELKRSATALEMQSQHLDKQNASRAFFDLFEMYDSVVSNVSWGSGTGRVTGKSALNRRVEMFDSMAQPPHFYTEQKLSTVHDRVNKDLGNYYRLIFRILSYLKQADGESKFYGDIFRAQLSNSELHLLFFNCLSEVGRPMMPLAAEFELFDNMPLPQSVHKLENILGSFDAKAAGKNEKLLALVSSAQQQTD